MGKGKGQLHKGAAVKKAKKPAAVVARPPNPPPPAAPTSNPWQLLASRSPSLSPSSSTPSHSRARRRAAMSKQDRRNFDKFLEFLHKYCLLADSFAVHVSYDQMLQHNDVGLTVATCNSQTCPQNWLLPAAREFLRAKGFGTEYSRNNETCLLFSESFPESMQWLKDSTKYNDLVRHVKVFQQGKMYVVTPTARGRLLFVTFMALMSENHSNNVSFAGDFNIKDILIIKHKKSPNEIMKILKDTVKAKDTHQAMVIALHRAVEIFIPLYKDSYGGFPVYFERFKKDMEGADKNLVANKWFRKYLRYHVAIMPSPGRRSFELSLHSACVNCRATLWGLEMVDICPVDWKSVVNPEPGKIKNVSIKALNGVYLHNVPNAGVKIHPYDDTLSEFIRFLRNFLEHGGQHESIVNDIEELELCLAMNFSDILPNLVRTLLEQEKM